MKQPGFISHVRLMSLVTALAVALMLQGCAFLVGTAAGGVAGYKLHDEGYKVQSPVVQESRSHNSN